MTVPLWAVALVVAAVAPFSVKTLARALESRRRARTAALLARASGEVARDGARGSDADAG